MTRKEAVMRFLIAPIVVKPLEDGKRRAERPGQVYDFYSPCWRVCIADNDWDEMTALEIKRLGV